MEQNNRGLVVLSLFDGMSGAHLAFDKAGLKVDKYFSSEIDKYAIQIADKNYPEDSKYRLGSVIDMSDEALESLPDIDVLIGGSPCQGFSLAGKLKGSSTTEGVDVTTLEQYLELKEAGFEFQGQSYLFWEYVRVWKAVKPRYFFLENVRITKKWRPMFDETMGVEPIAINSKLLSAQSRPRLYWTNIPGISIPEDAGIILADILEDGADQIGAVRGRYLIDGVRQDAKMLTAGLTTQQLEPRKDSKSNCLTTVQKDNVVIIDSSVKPSVAKNIERDSGKIMESPREFFTMEASSGWQDNKVGLTKSPCLRAGNSSTYILQVPEATKKGYAEVKDGDCFDYTQPNSKTRRGMEEKSNTLCTSNSFMRYEHPTYRKLYVTEAEALQTVPRNYTEGVSITQRFRMLGNGFTISVIAHLLKGIKNA